MEHFPLLQMILLHNFPSLSLSSSVHFAKVSSIKRWRRRGLLISSIESNPSCPAYFDSICPKAECGWKGRWSSNYIKSSAGSQCASFHINPTNEAYRTRNPTSSSRPPSICHLLISSDSFFGFLRPNYIEHVSLQKDIGKQPSWYSFPCHVNQPDSIAPSHWKASCNNNHESNKRGRKRPSLCHVY